MQAFRFVGDGSDKFWRVEASGDAFAVNWGKTGTTGRYLLKEFSDAQECAEEAAKLVASKTKGGYQPFPQFDADAQLYMDDPEVGVHRLTSHPRFRAHFTQDLYFDCTDEDAPFGSDEGDDVLSTMQTVLRKDKAFDFAAFPATLVGKYWGMTYYSVADLSTEAVEQLVASDGPAATQSVMVTYAAGFAQIKITGRIDPALQAAALSSLHSMDLVTGQPSETRAQMIADLQSFRAQ